VEILVLEDWIATNLETVLSDDFDLNARLEAVTSLGECGDEGVANSLKEFVVAQNAPVDLLVECSGALALLWCELDSFDPKFLIGLEIEECLQAMEEVFIPYRPEWVRLLPHMGDEWE